MFRSVGFISFLAGVTLSLAACETAYPIKVHDPQLVAQPDKVSMMLAQAADKASNALESLAAVEQVRTPDAKLPAIADAPPELARAMTVSWVGPVEQITRSVANKAGYQFAVLGSVPATPIVVDIDATNKPIIEILRSIGLQLGSRADIHVDGSRRIVELGYIAVTGAGDVGNPRLRRSK